MKKRSARDAGKTVDDYVLGLQGWQREVVLELRAIIREAAPGATESIKWGQPVYEVNGPFCYVRAFASSVNFGFWRGASLSEPRLESAGKKMGHLKLTGPRDVDARALRALIRQAVALNQRDGDPTRR